MSVFDLFAKLERERTPEGPVSCIICGLGNPGAEYAHSRHNAGFDALELLAQKLGVTVDRAKFHSLTATAALAGQRVLLMKPQTYMNLSGNAVGEAAKFYKVPAERVFVLCDDISLPCGRLRIRAKGSAGGHNGLKSIIACLGTEEFIRIRLGVGIPPRTGDDAVISWVLGRPVPSDMELLNKAQAEAILVPEVLLTKNVAAACERFNGFDASKTE